MKYCTSSHTWHWAHVTVQQSRKLLEIFSATVSATCLTTFLTVARYVTLWNVLVMRIKHVIVQNQIFVILTAALHFWYDVGTRNKKLYFDILA